MFKKKYSVVFSTRQLFMLFNPVEDELITGGVGGTKVKISKNDGTPQGRIYQYSETFLNRNPV
jgi:hypothetical protein